MATVDMSFISFVLTKILRDTYWHVERLDTNSSMSHWYLTIYKSEFSTYPHNELLPSIP